MFRIWVLQSQQACVRSNKGILQKQQVLNLGTFVDILLKIDFCQNNTFWYFFSRCRNSLLIVKKTLHSHSLGCKPRHSCKKSRFSNLVVSVTCLCCFCNPLLSCLPLCCNSLQPCVTSSLRLRYALAFDVMHKLDACTTGSPAMLRVDSTFTLRGSETTENVCAKPI